jgi:hypothetical protein
METGGTRIYFGLEITPTNEADGPSYELPVMIKEVKSRI